ncbi:MAG: BatD family protein, partial [Bacteroidota bacterium]
MRNVIFILIIGLVFILNAFPQDVRFTAKAKSAVAEGDQFRLVYEVNASGSGFRAPDLSDFNVLMGPSSQQSSSIQIINGQVTQNVSNSYTYLLQAKKEGKYEIAPAEITVGGKSYQSNSLTIDVVKGTPPVSSGQSNQGGGGQNSAVNASGDDLYVRIHLSRSSLYQGEHLVATIKIYTKLNLVGFEDMKFPSFNGFWSQDVETPKQIQLVREMINGEAYNVGVLAQYVLYPQRSGELTIDPFEIDCVVQKRVSGGSNNFFDSFFSRYQNFSQKAISPSVKVNVMSLPSNKPDGFT